MTYVILTATNKQGQIKRVLLGKEELQVKGVKIEDYFVPENGLKVKVSGEVEIEGATYLLGTSYTED